jgi:hypothetical protein
MHFLNKLKIQHPPSGNFHFDFSSQGKTFYIGGAPDLDAGLWLTLDGALGHLEFDPNDSCMSCGG